MDEGSARVASPRVLFLLAGLQAGVAGALAMLLWLALASVWYRRSLWHIPNLLATTFHGEAALRHRFSFSTVSGIALHVLIYAALGAAFALAVQDRWSPARKVLLGIILAVAWYYISFHVLWNSVNPIVALYSPDRPLLVGHIIYGGMIARFPAYLRSLTHAFQPNSLTSS